MSASGFLHASEGFISKFALVESEEKHTSGNLSCTNRVTSWIGLFLKSYLFSDSTVQFMLLAYLFDSRQIICLLNTNYAFVKALTTAVARNWHTSTPPIDLHLIFEKSSLKNPVGQTWFLIILNLKFAGSQAVKINFEICRPNIKFIQFDFSIIKCK